MKYVIFFFSVLFFAIISGCQPGIDKIQTCDIVVYGGTSAGVSAALQAARMNKNVILVCPEEHLGGMTTSGLGWTDSGQKEAIGGIAREFYQRLKHHYDQPDAWIYQEQDSFQYYRADEDAIWVFEPQIAEHTFDQMLEEAGVTILRNQWLDRESGVTKTGNRIRKIKMLNNLTFESKIFIDASYEGDLMAAAGVTYTIGRESNAEYNETLNGVQTNNAIYHQFIHQISPYRISGDSSSGLLPNVHHDGPGEEGTADQRVQAYNFRLCLTDEAQNMIPFPKPANYDPLNYEILARYIDAGWDDYFFTLSPMPNRKTDTNNNGPFSTDFIGQNYDYPEASYKKRRKIIQAHKDYQQGLMWFLSNDQRVPDYIRERISEWGLAKDEFSDNGYWPYQIYVREARRMVSDFVMTEQHLRGQVETPESIGMGSYNMDSHNVQRYVGTEGFVRNEGDVQVNPGDPYAISYGAIIPRKGEADNLLVPVCASATHIAYGSIRMEPVFMILGQSAATAAVLAIDRRCSIQDLDYNLLRTQLLNDRQVLDLNNL